MSRFEIEHPFLSTADVIRAPLLTIHVWNIHVCQAIATARNRLTRLLSFEGLVIGTWGREDDPDGRHLAS